MFTASASVDGFAIRKRQERHLLLRVSKPGVGRTTNDLAQCEMTKHEFYIFQKFVTSKLVCNLYQARRTGQENSAALQVIFFCLHNWGKYVLRRGKGILACRPQR